MALNLGELYITLGANTEALNNLPPVIKSLESTLNKLEATVNRLNASMEKGFDKVASSAVRSSKTVQSSAEAKAKAEETAIQKMGRLQSQAIEMNKKFDQQVAKKAVAAENQKNAEIEKAWAQHQQKASSINDAWKAIDRERAKESKVTNMQIAAGFKTITAAEKKALNESKQAWKSAQIEIKNYEKELERQRQLQKQVDANLSKDVKKIVDNYDVMSDGLVQVGTRAKGASARLSGTTSRARNLGFAAQNSAYQIQDMIVQLELGTEVSRVLGQQLPQLLSGFGVMGALVGTAAAAIAALVPMIFSSGKESETASKKLEKYNDALKSSKSITDKFEESQARLSGTLSKFKIKDIQTEFDNLRKELNKFEPGFFTAFSGKRDIEKRLFEIGQALALARRNLALEIENGIKIDIKQTKAILNQTNAYNKGIISLREYEIQKKIIENIESLGIQDNKEAIALLEERIRLQAKLGDDENYRNIANEVKDLNLSLYQSNAILKDTATFGINAGESLRQYFSLTDEIKGYERSLESVGEEQAKMYANLLNVSTEGLNNEEIFRKIAESMARMAQQTKQATLETSNLVEIQKNVASLSDRIAGVKAGGGIFSQMFTPELFKRASDFEKRTREIQQNLESKVAVGDTNILTNSIKEYTKIATESGMINPFAGINPNDAKAVAAGIAKVEQSVADLEQSAPKIVSTITQIISQSASLFGQLSSMYAEQASYHKQMAEQALSFGRDQATLYMQLADAVWYSNNKQAQSFNDRAIAAAEAAAMQYEAEKKAQARSNAIAKRNFENQKQLQIAQAIASTAAAVAGQLAMQPVGPWNIPLATALGALGAAQVALIQKQQYTPRETGGSIYGNKSYVVGESGPEIFQPGRSGTILSQKAIADNMTSQRGGDINVTFEINALDSRSGTEFIMANRGTFVNMIRQATDQRMGR